MRSFKSNYIGALYHTFFTYKTLNLRKGNKAFVYSPLIQSPCLSSYLFILIFITTLPITLWFMPFSGKIGTIKLIKGTNRTLYFISGYRSKEIFSLQKSFKKGYYIYLTRENLFTSVSPFEYSCYIFEVLRFILKFKTSFWYYPAITKLPAIIKLYKILEAEKSGFDEIMFTNHYDHWTKIILDFCKKNSKNSTLVQHGVVDDSAAIPEKKMGYLTCLVCYDAAALDFFKRRVFNNIECYKIQKPIINIEPIKNRENSILIISRGDVTNIPTEQDIISELLKVRNIIVYFKPHPNIKIRLYETIANQKGVNYICDQIFPAVDNIIHFGSTLAYEYQQTDSSVSIYTGKNWRSMPLLDNIHFPNEQFV